MATDQVRFPVGGDSATDQVRDIPAWERWNDYGIGLLRKGKTGSSKGQLRQSEHAFSVVETMRPGHGALNLARVYLKEGRLDDAVESLGRAQSANPPAPPWTTAWFTGLVNRENAFLDEAIENFRAILATRYPQARERGFDFAEDYRVSNALGKTLFQRARLERGSIHDQTRQEWLREAIKQFELTLSRDPENVTAHYNLSLIFQELGEKRLADQHASLHARYKPDDNARDRAITKHRRENAAANHAAEAVVVYDLQRPGSYGLEKQARLTP